MRVAALIVAAGRGTRAAATSVPKQYRTLGGRPVLARTIAALASEPRIETIQVVIHPDDRSSMTPVAQD